MHPYLILAFVIYIMIGLSITAFCVHMSYHEAAVGCGDSDDLKAQKVLESKMGLLGFIFLFSFWPVALLIAFSGKKHAKPTDGAALGSDPVPPAVQTPGFFGYIFKYTWILLLIYTLVWYLFL